MIPKCTNLSNLILETELLKQFGVKESFFIAKELAIIDINMLWYPEKLSDNIDRLRSLCRHIKITFPRNQTAQNLCESITCKTEELSSKIFIKTLDN